jgi:drug/metabolite transporter (DMT)-like permease
VSSLLLGYALTDNHQVSVGDTKAAAGLGYLNLLHIASSYESFRNLPAGQAMSLLYTYPIWNLAFGSLLGLERIGLYEWFYMGIAFAGSLLLNVDPGHVDRTPLGARANPVWGVFMGLVMALTESGMHTMLKSLQWRDAARTVWLVNSAAGLWLSGAVAADALWMHHMAPMVLPAQVGKPLDTILLTAFHSVTMFSGYWLRYYAVPRLSVVSYSILSYAGLLASYMFGLAFLGERPGWMSVVGALLILAGGLLLQTLPRDSKA